MKRRILKYKLNPYSYAENRIEVPRDAALCHFGLDLEGECCFWVEVNADTTETETWCFRCFWTGEYIVDDDLIYMDTINDGHLIWHIFRHRI